MPNIQGSVMTGKTVCQIFATVIQSYCQMEHARVAHCIRGSSLMVGHVSLIHVKGGKSFCKTVLASSVIGILV